MSKSIKNVNKLGSDAAAIRALGNRKALSPILLALMLIGTSMNAQADGFGAFAGLLAVPAVVGVAAKVAENMDAAQKEEEARIKAEEQRRIAEEQSRLAEAERLRKQEAYDRWFAGLTKDQQVQVTVEKEKTQRAQQQQQSDLLGAGIKAAGQIMARDVYVVQ